jgi:myo-inositol-1(or 4)-monophosphatase
MNYSPDFWDEVLTCAETLCDRVGQELLQFFGTVQPQQKEDGSLITQADRWADQALREGIQAQFPEHGLLTEETESSFPDTDWCWVIDPLDGTTNFARKIPIWGISLGLLYKGWPVFGYVAIPPLRENFYGFWSGKSGLDLSPVPPLREGAFSRSACQKSQPLSVFQGELTANHLFSFCTRSIHRLHHHLVLQEQEQNQTPQAPFPCKIRMLGVATYNLLTVANGLTVGGMEATPKVWDIAATWVICQAAGASWIFLQDQPFPLQPGQSYHRPSYPCLVIGNDRWREQFLSYL